MIFGSGDVQPWNERLEPTTTEINEATAGIAAVIYDIELKENERKDI